jgi:hypothetical protein
MIEVIAHLEGLVGANLTVTVEIDANISGGGPGSFVRTATENKRSKSLAVKDSKVSNGGQFWQPMTRALSEPNKLGYHRACRMMRWSAPCH